jgi:hypothetical protein
LIQTFWFKSRHTRQEEPDRKFPLPRAGRALNYREFFVFSVESLLTSRTVVCFTAASVSVWNRVEIIDF